LILYFIADGALKYFAPVYGKSRHTIKSSINMLYKYIIPVLIYFAITLGIPFLNGAYRNNRTNFLEHVVVVTVVCTIIILLLCLVFILKKQFWKKVFNR
jgi:hypothetical protein